MWGLDLDKYQFDGFLTWTIFFLNADGTIYGRYGTRSESGHDAESDKLISLEGFKKTLERTISLHKEYATSPKEVGETLADKTGPKRIWKHAEDIPEMEEMFRTKSRFANNGNKRCIHCHMVPRTEVAALHRLKKDIPDFYFWHFPLPRDIGIEMDTKEVATILKIRKDSIAAGTDLHVGDKIKSINGQPILSTADIQWILHHAREPDTLKMHIDRAGKSITINVPLQKDWRLEIDDWRYLNQLMQGYLVNFRAQPADSATRKKLGLRDDLLAFKVSWVNQWKKKPASPLRNGDVIVGINGNRKSLTVGAFTAYLFREANGKTVKLTIIRDGQTKSLKIKIP